MDHEEITKIMSPNGYGVGVKPNPFVEKQTEWMRRERTATQRAQITEKIEMLFEPRFITPPETSECIESIVTMSDARHVLELGTCTGFTSLHILRALVGKPEARLTTVDARPAHDRSFFELFKEVAFVEGWTPDVLSRPEITSQAPYDLVFVDSDHSIEHTKKELAVLWPLTKPRTVFLFHDVPEWQTPDNSKPVPIRTWLKEQYGLVCLPTCTQLDCLDVWGPGYPPQCNPHLGVFVHA